MVVYANHGATTPQRDDFSATREKGTIYAYRGVIADGHFLSRLEPGGDEGPIWMLSDFHGYYHEGQVFIDREILMARQQRVPPTQVTEINGRAYVEIGRVNGLEIEVDHARQVIWLRG